MNWIKKNKKKVAGVLSAVLLLFFAVADLTPTGKDDAVADKLKPIQEKLEDYANSTNTVATNQP